MTTKKVEVRVIHIEPSESTSLVPLKPLGLTKTSEFPILWIPSGRAGPPEGIDRYYLGEERSLFMTC